MGGYTASEEYEKDKAIFVELYKMLQPLVDREIISDYYLDSFYEYDRCRVTLELEFDVNEGNLHTVEGC